MNGLSWLIYFADVSNNVDWVFTVTTIISVVCVAGGVIFAVSEPDNLDSEDWAKWRKFQIYAVVSFFASIILGSVVPDKETVYAIAASEMGEKALNTDTGGKAVKALNNWLDKQIDNEPAATGNSS